MYFLKLIKSLSFAEFTCNWISANYLENRVSKFFKVLIIIIQEAILAFYFCLHRDMMFIPNN